MMAARQTMWGGEPLPYDAEVEYVESSGNCQVYTPMSFRDFPDARIEVTFGLAAAYSANRPFWGAHASSNGGHLHAGAGSSAASWWIGPSTPAALSLGTVATLKARLRTVVVDCPDDSASLDGSALSKPRTAWVSGVRDAVKTSAASWRLFSDGRSGYYASGVRIRSYRIALSGELVMDCVAVRVGNAGGLYDRVTGAVRPNTGGGTLVPGPDLRRGGV